MLGRALASQRIPHAYLFRGPDGVGKKLFAWALAAALNCRSRQGVDACGVCSSCKKFKTGNHPDFTTISPDKGVIKIEQIRNLTKDLSYPPYESQFRVVVLEDIQTMRREAANSLLKTLEEPPVGNVLVLTAEASQEVLQTLVSRCQVVPFISLDLDDTAAILAANGMSGDDSQLLARLAEGSPGRALLYHNADMVGTWKEVVLYLLDPGNDPARDVMGVLGLADKVAAMREDILPFLGLLRLWVRDMLLGGEEGMIPLSAGFRPKSWSSSELFAKLQAIDNAEKALARNCNRVLVCEVLLFALQ